ncbi:transcriptional repressor [hydrocarbon metagenome]|uniref:Transcriptional repressor n=1 Tax=hydrocarbon metagenome TaxID=938273 RepID=A0A0W8FDQ5_9ZZZZ|nr:DUF128 domain-containing protein [Methanomicrobiaceae archaeon]
MNPPLKFTNHRIEEYALQVTYNPEENSGSIIYNLSLIREQDLDAALAIMKEVHRAGISVSDRIRIAHPRERIGDYIVPDGSLAICTICSITLDALLLRRGVPLNPIGGGTLEVVDRVPRRFTSMLLYRDTTVDPLEVLVSQESTSIRDVMRRGNGNILANIRECHMEAEPLVCMALDELSMSGFSGILDFGPPNVPLFGVTVTPQYMGLAMVGGTNATAAIRESGRPVVIRALKGLMDISEMETLDDH